MVCPTLSPKLITESKMSLFVVTIITGSCFAEYGNALLFPCKTGELSPYSPSDKDIFAVRRIKSKVAIETKVLARQLRLFAQ